MKYKKPRFTNDEIERANNISLLNYAEKQDLNLKEVSPNSYHIKGYGGLYINPEDNTWYCFSKKKGGGPIQFVMFMEDKTWVEAMKELLEDNINNNIIKPSTYKNNNQEVTKDFILPEKNDTYKHMIAYLIKTRKIDKEIVYGMIKDEKLYEDKNKNCVFVGYDKKNNPKYANRRGTNTNKVFKGEIKNSDKSYPFYFGKGGDTVYVFESPIDALSHATIYKLKGLDWNNQYRLSLGGLSEKGLDRFLGENTEIKNVTFCLDNDEPGQASCKRLLEKYGKSGYNTKAYNIKEKDINNELVKLKKRINRRHEHEIEL